MARESSLAHLEEGGIEIEYGQIPDWYGCGFETITVYVDRSELKGPIDLGPGLVSKQVARR